MLTLPAALCVGFLTALLWSLDRAPPEIGAVLKGATSAAFVVFGVTIGALDAGPAGIAVFVGLVLSAVGDIALIGKERRPFLIGLGAFLLAHVAYIVAFLLLGVAPAATLGALAVLAVFGLGIWRWLSDGASLMARPVQAYITIISVMVATAVGAFVASPASQVGVRAGLLGAALLFFLSDLMVARERFVASDLSNRLAGLPLYYLAQLLFAGFIAQTL